jgi:hypothetical protein
MKLTGALAAIQRFGAMQVFTGNTGGAVFPSHRRTRSPARKPTAPFSWERAAA